jgi:hypothetical protein
MAECLCTDCGVDVCAMPGDCDHHDQTTDDCPEHGLQLTDDEERK